MQLSPRRLQKLSSACLVIVLALLPVFGYLAYRVQFGTAFVEHWLPADDADKRAYQEFKSRFGNDQVLIAGWSNCQFGDQRLHSLAESLKSCAQQQPELGIRRVISSHEMVRELSQGEFGFTERQALDRLHGFFIGKDDTGFVLALLDESNVESRQNLIELCQSTAKKINGASSSKFHLAGEPFQLYVIDRASRQAMENYVVPSSLLAFLAAWLCIGELRLTLTVFFLAGIGQLLGLALITVFYGEMSAVLVVLPTLIFMLVLSASVHLASYYREGGGHSHRLAGMRAIYAGGLPCLLASLTTAFGFGSLAISQLSPVWKFGSLAVLGLILATLILLLAFPAATKTPLLAWFFPSTRRSFHASPSRGANLIKAIETKLSSLSSRFANEISYLGVILLIGSLLGIIRLQSSTDFKDMFPADNPARSGLGWIEETLGPIGTLELIVQFDSPGDSTLASSPASTEDAQDVLSQVSFLAALQNDLESMEFAGASFSAANLIPTIPEGSGARKTIRRAVIRRSIFNSSQQFKDGGLLFQDDQVTQWRLSLRVHELTSDRYDAVRREIIRLADEHASASLAPVTLHLTGLRSLAEEAHHALLSDLASSFATAFLLITPVMMLIMRDWRLGAMVMIPNLLPVALVFGLMGWVGIKLDVASILTASVALGIAVDDTLHFVHCHLKQIAKGSSVNDAVKSAIHVCARPMLQTTCICTCAMFPFFFSDFLPTSKFALLMILILLAAIIGDLLVLPAMLQSRVGVWLHRLARPTGRSNSPE